MRRNMLWIVGLCIVMVGLVAGPDLWAAPGQDPARQTVPTRTPIPEPTEPPPTETPSKDGSNDKDNPTPTPIALATPAVVSETVSTAETAVPVLPEAGGRSFRPHLGWPLIMLGFLLLAFGTWPAQVRPGGSGGRYLP